MKKFSVLIILFGILSTTTLRAQSGHITGTSTCNLGSTYTYTFNDGNTSYVNGVWVITGGSVTGSSHTSGSAIWTANVQWTFAGSGSVVFSAFGSQKGSLSVTVNCTSTPSPPTNGVGGSACGSNQATISATPGSGGNTLRWYSASSGGSFLSQGTSYTAGSGTYYAATYSTSNGCESSTRLAVTITGGTAPPPPSVVSTGSTCPGGTVTLTGSAAIGWIVWYTDNSTGNHNGGYVATQTTSFTTPALSSTTTYYMGAYDPASGCDTSPNARTPITATVLPLPSTPNTPSVSSNVCGPKTLSFVGSPPGGDTWYWQGTTSNGTST